MRLPHRVPVFVIACLWAGLLPLSAASGDPFGRAAANGRLAAEGFARCDRYLHAWMKAAEPTTQLIPRNLTDSPYWNGKDSAADNYPFMVLAASFTDPAAFDGPMRTMLANEAKLTARPGFLRLTDDYNLQGTPGLRHPTPSAERILFNSAEYVKDGLLPLTEWLGPSPWSERMIALLDDSFALAAVDTPFGKVPLVGRNKEVGVEVSGDYLQALARVYWFSGRDEKYLRWGARLADLYLLPEGKHHPTRDFTALRLRDHGCEIVSGLCELYATATLAGRLPGGAAWKAKSEAWRPHLHELLDRILEVGRNEDGLLWNEVNPQTGQVTDVHLSDSWGYVFDGFYTVYLIDGTEAYREAALKPLGALDEKYHHFNWEPRDDPALPNGSMDGYADALESALNLCNRELADPRAQSALAWLDEEIRILWAGQKPDGFIEKWHGDGNFARTTIMYCLWKTQGLSLAPWRTDVRLGAIREGGKLLFSISADHNWTGRVVFDHARHADHLKLPLDWPRINQFPEWFVVAEAGRYSVRDYAGESIDRRTGEDLLNGLPVLVVGGTERRFEVTVAK